MSTAAQLQAFNNIHGSKAKSIEDMVLWAIWEQKELGMTKKELEVTMEMKHQTITSRLSSLQDQGKIFHKDEVKDGCTVWHYTPKSFVEEQMKKQHHKKFKAITKRLEEEFNMPKILIVELKSRFMEINHK